MEPLLLDTSVCADELRRRLELLQQRREQGMKDDPEESLDEEEFRKDQKKKRDQFLARRKAHYNEFLVMKELR